MTIEFELTYNSAQLIGSTMVPIQVEEKKIPAKYTKISKIYEQNISLLM